MRELVHWNLRELAYTESGLQVSLGGSKAVYAGDVEFY